MTKADAAATTTRYRDSDFCVLILGAGFSAPWGPPVMASFMSRARRQFYNHRAVKNSLTEHYERMLDFQTECRAASWLFNRDWDNIEELYTQADLLRLAFDRERTGADQLESGIRCKHIAWAIWDVYRLCNLLKPVPLGAVIGQTRKYLGLKTAIITTNYDVLCEIGLNQGSLSDQPKVEFFYPGFKTIPLHGNTDGILVPDADTAAAAEYPDDMVPIVKLHGSVNWFETREHKKWYASLEFGARNDKPFGINDPSFTIENLWEYLNANGIDDQASPAIIPPMLGKSALHAQISRQWKDAILTLERARRIFVIGYSFPETDVFMLRLLTEGLKHNNGLEEITVVNREQLTESWRLKLSKFFTPVAREKTLWYFPCDAEIFVHEFTQAGNAFTRFVENDSGLRRRVL